MKVFILMTKCKMDDPEIAGVFSSFDKAVAYFVRVEFHGTTMPVAEMQSRVVQIALEMARKKDGENFVEAGGMKAWVEEHEVDECCAVWEKGCVDDGE